MAADETSKLQAESERKKRLKKEKKLEKLDLQLAPLQTTRNMQMGQTAMKPQQKGILKANQTLTGTADMMTQARTTASGAFFGTRSKSTAVGENPQSRFGMRTQQKWINFAD